MYWWCWLDEESVVELQDDVTYDVGCIRWAWPAADAVLFAELFVAFGFVVGEFDEAAAAANKVGTRG